MFLLRYLPFSLAIREIQRIRALSTLEYFECPVLDVGCGDGLFWETLIYDQSAEKLSCLKELFGIDISSSELQLCCTRLDKHGANSLSFDISSCSLENSELRHLIGKCKTVIANCSLEHVPDIQNALINIKKVLAPGGTFVLFLPHPRWTRNLSFHNVLSRVSDRLSGCYAGLFDGLFQHYHLYPHYVWKAILESCGFSNVDIKGIGSKSTNRYFSNWVPASIPAFAWKSVSGKYPSWYSSIKRASVIFLLQQVLRKTTPSKIGLKISIKRQTGLVNEIVNRSFIKDDLEDPTIVEFFIRCNNVQ